MMIVNHALVSRVERTCERNLLIARRDARKEGDLDALRHIEKAMAPVPRGFRAVTRAPSYGAYVRALRKYYGRRSFTL